MDDKQAKWSRRKFNQFRKKGLELKIKIYFMGEFLLDKDCLKTYEQKPSTHLRILALLLHLPWLTAHFRLVLWRYSHILFLKFQLAIVAWKLSEKNFNKKGEGTNHNKIEPRPQTISIKSFKPLLSFNFESESKGIFSQSKNWRKFFLLFFREENIDFLSGWNPHAQLRLK